MKLFPTLLERRHGTNRMQIRVGRTVLFRGGIEINGVAEHPALVNRVNADDMHDLRLAPASINVTVFPNGSGGSTWHADVLMFCTREWAKLHIANHPRAMTAFWCDRADRS